MEDIQLLLRYNIKNTLIYSTSDAFAQNCRDEQILVLENRNRRKIRQINEFIQLLFCALSDRAQSEFTVWSLWCLEVECALKDWNEGEHFKN